MQRGDRAVAYLLYYGGGGLKAKATSVEQKPVEGATDGKTPQVAGHYRTAEDRPTTGNLVDVTV